MSVGAMLHVAKHVLAHAAFGKGAPRKQAANATSSFFLFFFLSQSNLGILKLHFSCSIRPGAPPNRRPAPKTRTGDLGTGRASRRSARPAGTTNGGGHLAVTEVATKETNGNNTGARKSNTTRGSLRTTGRPLNGRSPSVCDRAAC